MDYGFIHDGRVYTPNASTDIPVGSNDERNKAIEARELEIWDSRPDRFVAYYDLQRKQVSTWLGTVVGDILTSRVYRHNLGGRFVSLRMRGTNGATYYGRASYDWGTVIKLRRAK